MLNTPDIRFRGFTEPWEQCRLGDLFSFNYGDGNNNPSNGGIYPVFGAGGIQGGYTRYNAENSVIIGHMGDAGCVSWGEGKHFVTYNGTITKPRDNVFSSKFGYYLLVTMNLRKYRGGSGLPFLTYDMLEGMNTLYPPNYKESQKISQMFSSIDNLIALYQCKCDEMSELKKFLLRKMFPREGAQFPEIRFSGFIDPWKKRKIGDIAGITYGGGTPKTSVEEYWDGEIPWVQSSNLSEHDLFNVDIQKHITELGLRKSAAQLVPKNSIAVVSHVGVGKLVFMPFDYTTSQDFISLCDLKTEPIFTCYALYKRLQEDLHIVQGSAIKGITKEDLLGKEITVPSEPEQRKIGATMQNLDTLITLHQRKCDELKAFKKFMLQNMFPKKG